MEGNNVKKRVIISFAVLAIVAGFIVNTHFNVLGEQTEPNIKWKMGIAIIDGIPKYFDPEGLINPDMFMSPLYRNKIKSEVINAGVLSWGGVEEPDVYIYNINKSKPYFRLYDTKRVLYYRVDQNKLYLSEDKKKWEEVKFKVVNDKEHIAEDDPSIKVYWVIYLECKWFKGEYEIISVPQG